MSIPKSFVIDMGGKEEVLRFESVLGELKWVENENLFADFPIGATMQDGGRVNTAVCPRALRNKLLNKKYKNKNKLLT